MPTRNRWEFAGEAAASVLEQQAVALELLVVDDGSERPAPPGFAADPRVRVLRHERSRGVAASRNRGIIEARAPWIALLDDDDIWAPWHLSGLLAAVRAAGACWAFAGHIIITRRRAPIGNGPRPLVERDAVRQFLRTNPVGTPSCVLIAAETLRATGGFDERLSVMADWEMWVRLAAAGTPAVSRSFTVGYTLHRDNMSLDVDGVLRDWRLISERYGPQLEQLGMAFGDNQYFWRWWAFRCGQQGRRLEAARLFLLAARRGGGLRDLVRAIGVTPVIGWPVRLRRLILMRLSWLRRRSTPSADQLWLGSFRARAAASGASASRGRISQRWRVRTRPSP
jgi:hypothetical protein